MGRDPTSVSQADYGQQQHSGDVADEAKATR